MSSSNPSERLTLRDAAHALGVSTSTLRRKVKAGEINAQLGSSPFGECWEIPRGELDRVSSTCGVDLFRIRAARDIGGHPSNVEGLSSNSEGPPPGGHPIQVEGVGGGLEDIGGPPPELGGPPRSSDGGHPTQVEGVEPLRGGGVLQEGPPDPLQVLQTAPLQEKTIPLEVHSALVGTMGKLLDQLAEAQQAAARERELAGEERKARELAERRAISLAYELQGYQRSLGDQAESLAEERAKRMALEMAAAQVVHHDTRLDPTRALDDVAPSVAKESGAGNVIGCGAQTSGGVTSTAREKAGWGKRFRRWFLGEKTA